MKHTREVLPLTAAAIGALLLAGCGAGDTDRSETITPENQSTRQIADNPSDGSAEPSGSASQTPNDAMSDSEKATLAAVDTALGRYQGAQAVEVDHDDSNDTFEVDVFQDGSRYRVTTDGSGENATGGDDDKDSVDEEDVARFGRASITLEEAVKRAFEKATETQSGGVSMDEVSLDEENDQVYWEVELDSGDQDLEYRVNANTGTIEPKD